MRHTQTGEARHGQEGCIGLAFFQLAHPGGDIAPEGDDLQIGPQRQRLCFPPQGGGAEPGAFGQFLNGLCRLREETIARIFPLREGNKLLARWQHGWHVFQAVNSNVEFSA